MQDKSDLEENLRNLKEQEKILDQRARILCQRVIQEIKKRNLEKKLAINQLRKETGEEEYTQELENSIQEAKKQNSEKEVDINRLKEEIGSLEAEFGDLAAAAAAVTPFEESRGAYELQDSQSKVLSPYKGETDQNSETPLEVFPI